MIEKDDHPAVGARVTLSERAPVLVVRATGRIGRAVIADLLHSRRPVRALVRRPPPTAFPPDVEVVVGDLTEPDSLTPALAGVEAVCLVWAAGPVTVSAVVARLARSVQRVVFLSSPHQTPHPFFGQPNPMAALHANIEQEGRTRSPGGRLRFARATRSDGRTARSRRRRSTSATSPPWRCARSPKRRSPAETTSSRARRP